MSWRPNDYVPNPQSDRDSECMKMRLSKVSPTNSQSNSSYNPNMTKTEDTFCNSIITSQQFSNGSRFSMPNKKNLSNSNKTRFEGFQA
jgi:hypothetical protein